MSPREEEDKEKVSQAWGLISEVAAFSGSDEEKEAGLWYVALAPSATQAFEKPRGVWS